MDRIVITHRCCCRAECTEPRRIELLMLCSPWGAGGAQQLGGDTKSAQRHPNPYSVVLSSKRWGKGGRGGHSQWQCLSSQEVITCNEPCFPGSGWAAAWQWEAVNEFLALLWLSAKILLYLIDYSISAYEFSRIIYLSGSLPHPTWGGERAAARCLFTCGVKPPHHHWKNIIWVLNHRKRISRGKCRSTALLNAVASKEIRYYLQLSWAATPVIFSCIYRRQGPVSLKS